MINTYTKNWIGKDYLKYIMDNNLNNIWKNWCNPMSIDGVRVGAYTPIYPDNNIVELFERKCPKQNCDGDMIITSEDRERRVLYKRVCNKCGRKQNIIYRWVSGMNKAKLLFNLPNMNLYGARGRSFYATNVIYHKEIIRPKFPYIQEEFMNSCMLNIDIDIKRGTICDSENRSDLHKAISIIRDELDTFASDSYNLQTSGNGVYIMIHHNLVTKDIMNTMARYNAWIIYMDKIIKNSGITKVKLDAINMPSRVFKMMGSLHQKYDLACIPLAYDCNINNMDSSEFKVENFDINEFISDDELMYYNRCNIRDMKGLYSFLEEYTKSGLHDDLRAVRYDFRESAELITNEKQDVDDSVTKEEIERFISDRIEWKKFKIDVPGRVLYRNNGKEIEIEMLGVREKDKPMIRDKIMITARL